MLEKANDIIYTHDLEGNFTSANEGVERILGYRPEEFVLMNMAQVLPAEHLDRARQMVQRKIAQGDRTTYELDVLAKDGRRVTLEVLYPYLDPDIMAAPDKDADRHREAFARLEEVGVTWTMVQGVTRTAGATRDFLENFGATYLGG